MKLHEVIQNLKYSQFIGLDQVVVSAVEFDSRKVKPETLFVAQRGAIADGHKFIAKAIENGAVAIVCEEIPEILNPEVSYIQVSDSNEALGLVAASFYGNPSEKMKVVGVTGTNGKTSIHFVQNKRR